MSKRIGPRIELWVRHRKVDRDDIKPEARTEKELHER